MVIFFYVGNECLSIIENLGIIGVPLPDGLVKFIEQLSKEGSNNNVKDDTNE
ncbi:phage holin family protein [Chryseomicrobium aureum]|uniref:phage holin family protein n=1 Tax=Chryseomicrobium aureum TaxID=1441723 RepID=UPI00370DCC87